jgi:hypothetical protein
MPSPSRDLMLPQKAPSHPVGSPVQRSPSDIQWLPRRTAARNTLHWNQALRRDPKVTDFGGFAVRMVDDQVRRFLAFRLKPGDPSAQIHIREHWEATVRGLRHPHVLSSPE